jgi:hypothetical protein
VLQSIVFSSVFDQLTLTYSLPLVSGALNPLQWTGVYGTAIYEGVAANAAGNVVTVDMTSTGFSPVSNRSSFTASAGDVKTPAGVLAAAFSDVPTPVI